MNKFELTLADGSSKTYSRRIDAVRAGDKSDGGYRLRSPRGEVLVDTLPAADAGDTVVTVDGAKVAETKRVDATKSRPAKGKGKAAATKAATTTRVRFGTWDASADNAEHQCAGACGVIQHARAFPTTGKPGMRGTECRTCRDARLTAAKGA